MTPLKKEMQRYHRFIQCNMSYVLQVFWGCMIGFGDK